MATPQPDFRIVSRNLTEAAQQLSLIPYMPAVDHENYFRNQFTTLRQSIDELFRLLRFDLDTRFEQVNTRFEALFEQVNIKFDNLELSTKVE